MKDLLPKKKSRNIAIAWFCFPEIYSEYVYSVDVYQKYLTRFGELIIFEPWRENYHFSPPG